MQRPDKKSRSDFQRYVFRVQLMIVLSLALILGGVGVTLSLKEEARQRDLNLRNIAEAVAQSSLVRQANGGERPGDLTESLDTLKDSLADIDVISVVGRDGVRLYHSNHDLIGTVFDGEAPDFSESNESYTVNGNGPSGVQRRAYAVLTDDEGDNAGFVMTIMLMTSIRARERGIIFLFVLVILLVVLAELFLSYHIAGRIRKRLLGYEPDAFSAMFLVREKTLESLDEGIVAVNREGKMQFMNASAAQLLNTENGSMDPESVEKLFGKVLTSGEKELSVPVSAGEGTDVLIDRVPLLQDGEIRGAVGILHDRTAYTKLAEDLAGTRFLVDSMRANNHEFTNKLHVILGLIQMERYEDAAAYIQKITLVQRENVSRITQSIEMPAVAALLIGKTARAAEVNVKLILQKGSVLRRDDVRIPEDCLVTVIGNLVDNALDAMDGEKSRGGELFIGIHTEPGSLYLTVDDNGPGIPEDVLPRIFDKGWSTKGEGRGTGLFEVKRAVEARGGQIFAESQPGQGTSFTVTFTENGGKDHV